MRRLGLSASSPSATVARPIQSCLQLVRTESPRPSHSGYLCRRSGPKKSLTGFLTTTSLRHGRVHTCPANASVAYRGQLLHHN